MKNSSKKDVEKTETKKVIADPKKTPLPDKKDDKRIIIKTEPSTKPIIKK